jgi:hypothetical protein
VLEGITSLGSSGNDSLPRGFGVGIGLLLHKFRVACDCINAVKISMEREWGYRGQ